MATGKEGGGEKERWRSCQLKCTPKILAETLLLWWVGGEGVGEGVCSLGLSD